MKRANQRVNTFAALFGYSRGPIQVPQELVSRKHSLETEEDNISEEDPSPQSLVVPWNYKRITTEQKVFVGLDHPLLEQFDLVQRQCEMWALLLYAQGEVVRHETLDTTFGNYNIVKNIFAALRRTVKQQEKEEGSERPQVSHGFKCHRGDGYSFTLPKQATS